MVATTWPKIMIELLNQLKIDFPDLTFKAGEVFSWSSKDHTVFYVKNASDDNNPIWSLLHEVGHGLLEHQTYATDFELVHLEAAAWEKATALGKSYGHQVDQEHIQDCLDTYRDWLHQRSACPNCLATSLQSNMTTYCCYNCNASWRVTRSRICRPYRRLQKQTTRP